MPKTYQVIDLFAGPGGLAEGFSALRTADDHQPFSIALSVEKEASAHRTLLLRSFLRQFEEPPPEYYSALNGGAKLPDWSDLYPEEWSNAQDEAQRLELGTPEAARVLDGRIDALRRIGAETVVIGGPPCQAYSLVGRARNRERHGYVPAEDKRHFLYREYIRVLSRLRPAGFVMENVSGLLSSSVNGDRIFDQVRADLRKAGGEPDSYQLFAITNDADGHASLKQTERGIDYVIRAEDFGVPQARHRVIVVGLRSDKARMLDTAAVRAELVSHPATVRDVLAGMPALRSGLSTGDDGVSWRRAVRDQMEIVIEALGESDDADLDTVRTTAKETLKKFRNANRTLERASSDPSPIQESCPKELSEWLADPLLEVTLNHVSRGHMQADLGRYFYSSVFAGALGRSPKANEFPAAIAPAHQNWASGDFSDRFRTQCWDRASTTVTSHISKDGHYFIHPDPLQCRSLTVREAARLQTFPDNYLFLGNRTEQYVQVGNAVPPFLAEQIADVLWHALEAAR